MLPPDSNGMMSVSAAIVNLGTKSINPNQEIDDRPSGMRVCDGEYEETSPYSCHL